MSDVQLSQNFWLSEFACSCGCGAEKRPMQLKNLKRLVFALEKIRAKFGGKALHINSGVRCLAHNSKTPGASTGSKHVTGEAADIRIDGVHPDKVADFAETLPEVGGVGRYNGRTHVDVRPRAGGHISRWDYRNKAA